MLTQVREDYKAEKKQNESSRELVKTSCLISNLVYS